MPCSVCVDKIHRMIPLIPCLLVPLCLSSGSFLYCYSRCVVGTTNGLLAQFLLEHQSLSPSLPQLCQPKPCRLIISLTSRSCYLVLNFYLINILLSIHSYCCFGCYWIFYLLWYLLFVLRYCYDKYITRLPKDS